MKLSGNSVLTTAMIGIVWIIIVRFVLPFDAIPYRFEEFLYFKGQLYEPILFAWPLFAAGFVINFWKMATTVNSPQVQASAPEIPGKGFSLSLAAGVLEEIAFRWVLMYAFMGLFWVLGIVFPDIKTLAGQYLSWFTTLLVGNSAETVLSHPGAWTLPLAVLCSNWKFQKGHLYLGFVGWLFAWFGGIAFFMVLFRYGLFAGMFTHFLFDWMVFLMLYVDIQIEKGMGLTDARNRIYQWY